MTTYNNICPKCRRNSFEWKPNRNFYICLYDTCGYVKKVPTLEDRVSELEKRLKAQP